MSRMVAEVDPLEGSPVWEMAAELRDVLPIDTLHPPDLHDLTSHMQVRRFAAGEVIYHRGDPAVDAFVVHRGLVKTLLHDEEGRELLVSLHGRGQFFGTLTLFRAGSRESTVAAVIPTTALQIAREDALRVVERNPRAMRFMFEHLAVTIHQLAALLEGIVFLDVPGRLAKYLVELEGVDGMSLTQDDIAAAIGSTRVTVNKLLADFERRGLIKVQRKQVAILDEAGLRQEILR